MPGTSPGMTKHIFTALQPERSPRVVMPSAVPVMHAGVALKWLAVPRRCERKSGILAAIRECSRGRRLALRVAGELAQPRQAVVPALQAVGIIVGIIWLSGCRQCREYDAHKRRGSNEFEHFNFLPLTAIHGALPRHYFSSARGCQYRRHSKSRSGGWSQGRVLSRQRAEVAIGRPDHSGLVKHSLL
jgi:hypothetical protein